MLVDAEEFWKCSQDSFLVPPRLKPLAGGRGERAECNFTVAGGRPRQLSTPFRSFVRLAPVLGSGHSIVETDYYDSVSTMEPSVMHTSMCPWPVGKDLYAGIGKSISGNLGLILSIRHSKSSLSIFFQGSRPL